MNLLIFNALSWEQRKLLDCIQKITDFRGRTPKKLGMDWSEEGYLALSALNVKDGYIDFNQDVHYGNQELYDKWMTSNELHKGQVLFTTEAPMGNVAQVPDNRRYILSQRVIAFDVKDNLLTENFLATVLRTPTVFAYLTALSSGGTAKGVSQKSLSSVEIRLPKDLKEQEIIADTFSNLDRLITLHQSKAESWKNKKNQLSTISWEQRKLSNTADIVGGGTPSTSNPDYWDGDIDWYTPAEIGEQIFAYESVRKITKEGLIHSSAKILPAHKTVLFTSRAGIGNMAILKHPAATNQGFQSLVCHDDIDPYFMFSMGDSIKAKARCGRFNLCRNLREEARRA